VELLMQQFGKGIADLEKLATWLSRVLKSHCAPMRDDWVDETYKMLSAGNRENNMEKLVAGMRHLLGVLEAMKLDVANHQIRCMRPKLIEDTVHFEQKYFKKKREQGKVDVSTSTEWYRSAYYNYAAALATPEKRQAFGDMAVFFEALTHLLLPSNEELFPNTFAFFDEERLLKLRSDMLDAINLEICMMAYEELEQKNSGRLAFPNLADESHDFNFNTSPAPSRTSSRPSSWILCSSSSTNSSPRSSLILPTKPVDSAQSRARARDLYSSLVAILHATPSTSRQGRWQSLAPMMALQVLRFTNAQLSELPQFERELNNLLFDIRSDRYNMVERRFQEKLLDELAERVKQFRGLSGVSLFSVATGGRLHGPGRTWDGGRDRERDLVSDGSLKEAREDGGIEDMATRLAHLGVLHWRVWADMAYHPIDAMDTDPPLEPPMI
jgi:T-complex protein 11